MNFCSFASSLFAENERVRVSESQFIYGNIIIKNEIEFCVSIIHFRIYTHNIKVFARMSANENYCLLYTIAANWYRDERARGDYLNILWETLLLIFPLPKFINSSTRDLRNFFLIPSRIFLGFVSSHSRWAYNIIAKNNNVWKFTYINQWREIYSFIFIFVWHKFLYFRCRFLLILRISFHTEFFFMFSLLSFTEYFHKSLNLLLGIICRQKVICEGHTHRDFNQ